MNIYFSGSIGGGRQKRDSYKELINHCKKFGAVWNQCIGKSTVKVHKSFDVYSRNMDWIDNCDIFIADVTVPSLGVGMEIEHAIRMNPEIPILCIYDKVALEQPGLELSRMITNCPKIKLAGYSRLEVAEAIITQFIEEHGVEASK